MLDSLSSCTTFRFPFSMKKLLDPSNVSKSTLTQIRFIDEKCYAEKNYFTVLGPLTYLLIY